MEQQAMTRAEEKARLARVAVRVLAREAAKRQIKNQIRARGERISDYSNKDLTLRAEAMLATHPELIVEARETAAKLGYAPL
jgi:hypothetical protein